MHFQRKNIGACLLSMLITISAVSQAKAFEANTASEGLLNTSPPIPGMTPSMVPAKLQGNVSIVVADPFVKTVDDLVDAGDKLDADQQKYNSTVDKYSSWKYRTKERAMDALNYSLLFKGVSPSKEGGDVILNEKLNLKSLAAARYLKQKTRDERELKVLSDVFQIATGLGDADQTNGQKQVDEAKADLTKIAGAEAAEHAIANLKALPMKDDLLTTDGKALWSITESQKRMRATIQASASQDPIVDEITADVHHFNCHSKAVMIAHRVVRVTLSTISLCPNLVGPAAQVILFGYLVLSGGTEQEKLMTELYLDKRLSSRATLLTEEAHMAFENYQLGAVTHNKVLMNVSEALIRRMTSGETAGKVLCAGTFAEKPEVLQSASLDKAKSSGTVAN